MAIGDNHDYHHVVKVYGAMIGICIYMYIYMYTFGHDYSLMIMTIRNGNTEHENGIMMIMIGILSEYDFLWW